MAAQNIVRDWEACVTDQLLPSLHAHQAKSLAAMSFGMVAAGHCHSGRIAVTVPGPAKPPSVRRRLERLLANPRLPARPVLQQLAEAVLRTWPASTVLLVLDETPLGNRLRCLKIELGYRKRATPLAAVCYRPDQPPKPMPALVKQLLRQIARIVPAGVQVTLLTDRGLAWPLVVDCCERFAWHYVLRVQGSTRVILPDGRMVSARELVHRPGMRYTQRVAAFKKASWRVLELTALWEEGQAEPWLVVSDQPGGVRRCRTYAKRMWAEESFRDEKSQGFSWQRSQVRDPKHAERLVLVMALAMLLAVSLGTWVLKSGLRRVLEATRCRKLSVFQLGLRWLRHAVFQDDVVVCRLCLHPT